MLKTILLRHAETLQNFEQRYISSSDPVLSKFGKISAEQKAQTMFDEINPVTMSKFEILVSPALRCRETASFFEKKFETEATVVEELREVDFGVLEGLSRTELLSPDHSLHDEFSRWRDPIDHVRPTGSETFDPILMRCKRVVRILEERPQPRIIISHGVFSRCLACFLCFGQNVKLYRSFSLGLLGQTTIEEYQEHVRIVDLKQFSQDRS